MHPQIHNRTIFTGDNLPVLRGMNSASVDLIYLDPPFNSNRNYAAPPGSTAAGATFNDAWACKNVDAGARNIVGAHSAALENMIAAAGAIGGRGDSAYLMHMAVRLLELRRVLKTTGALYLHCGPNMSHYLKLILDAVFGRENFRNEIVWSYGLGGASRRVFSKKHDVIFSYAKNMPDCYFVKPQVAATSARLAGQQKGMTDVWSDIPALNNMAKERTGYPTQKPLALLARIIRASCPPRGVVLDPCCGGATAAVAAESLGRRWIGIDICAQTPLLAGMRLRALRRARAKIIHRRDIPKRSACNSPRAQTMQTAQTATAQSK